MWFCANFVPIDRGTMAVNLEELFGKAEKGSQIPFLVYKVDLTL